MRLQIDHYGMPWEGVGWKRPSRLGVANVLLEHLYVFTEEEDEADGRCEVLGRGMMHQDAIETTETTY